MILTIEQTNAMVSRHGVGLKEFWQEAAGGDVVQRFQYSVPGEGGQ